MAVIIHRGMVAPPALPPKHAFYEIIGRVASEGAQLEHLLDEIIWENSGTDKETAACITSQLMGAPSRYHAVELLCLRFGLSEDLRKLIRTLEGQTSAVAEARNRIVHDAWYVEEDTKEASQFRAMPYKKPNQGKFGLVPIDQAEIDKTIAEYHRLQKEIGVVRTCIQTELASRKKPD